MALNWFKKKKHQQEEKTPSDQKIDEVSEAFETEDVVDTQVSENNDDPDYQELKKKLLPLFPPMIRRLIRLLP